MLNIFADAMRVASRTDGPIAPVSQEDRHKAFLAQKKQERRELEMARDRAFYRRW